MSGEYQASGTLPPPGPLGRLVRAGLGLGCLAVVRSVVEGWAALTGAVLPPGIGLWIIVALGLYAFPYVVSLGFTRRSSRLPRWAALALGIGWAALNLALTGAVWSAGLGWAIAVWAAYTFGHLGVSFLLAALLATPGCEMRAIAHLLARLRSGNALEHACPGLLDPLDRWELGRSSRIAS